MSKKSVWCCDSPNCEVTSDAKEDTTDFELALPPNWYTLSRGTWLTNSHFHDDECLRAFIAGQGLMSKP